MRVESSLIQALKISLLGRGIRLSPGATLALTAGGQVPLTVHEYPTSGGVTLMIGDDVYVTEPFDYGYGEAAEATLECGAPGETLRLRFRGEDLPVRVLPLPGYLAA